MVGLQSCPTTTIENSSGTMFIFSRWWSAVTGLCGNLLKDNAKADWELRLQPLEHASHADVFGMAAQHDAHTPATLEAELNQVEDIELRFGSPPVEAADTLQQRQQLAGSLVALQLQALGLDSDPAATGSLGTEEDDIVLRHGMQDRRRAVRELPRLVLPLGLAGVGKRPIFPNQVVDCGEDILLLAGSMWRKSAITSVPRGPAAAVENRAYRREQAGTSPTTVSPGLGYRVCIATMPNRSNPRRQGH